MMYYDFIAGGKEYKLRLNTRATVLLEKQLECNPISIFGAGDKLPTVTTMVTILHASLQQYHHGIDMNEAYNIFDAWIADNHAITDFVAVIIELYKVSGIIKIDEEPTTIEKN